MAAVSEERIAELLQPFAGGAFDLGSLATEFSAYLELLLRWNARTNLTAVREPEQIVQRHFGESVFAAALLAARGQTAGTLLDLGSGAGFPGLPMQLCLPGLRVTLAESQGKKASFLREAVRTLALRTEVWAARAETMPADRRFDVVALRAVDQMEEALESATDRVAEGGALIVLAGGAVSVPAEWQLTERVALPQSQARFVFRFER